MLNLIKSIFGTPATKEQTLDFDIVADGLYLVKYVDEIASVGKLILVIFDITRGEKKGTQVTICFDNDAAKKISREYSEDFVNQLQFEGIAIAEKIINNINDKRMKEFIVKIQDGVIKEVHLINEIKIKAFRDKIQIDSSYRG